MKNEQEICRMKAITVFVLVLAIFLAFSVVESVTVTLIISVPSISDTAILLASSP